MGNRRIRRAINKSVIPAWLSFQCGEDGADDDWSCGAACGNLLRIARSRTGMSQPELAEAAACHGRRLHGSNPVRGSRPCFRCWRASWPAVDLELRVTVKDCDSHDDALEARDARRTDDARLTGGQRVARRASQEEFVAKMRWGRPS